MGLNYFITASDVETVPLMCHMEFFTLISWKWVIKQQLN